MQKLKEFKMDKILYNVTIQIEHSVHNEWLSWMDRVHMPAMLDTGYFEEYTLSRLMGNDETTGFTYSIQYLAPSFSAYQEYQEKQALAMQQSHHEKFNGKYVVFRTLMKVIKRMP